MIRVLSTRALVTVGIIYYRPDYRSILQEFVWQVDDTVPDLVRVHRFLNFWKDNIEAVIERVDVSYKNCGETGWRSADWIGNLNG